jgi:hypothetical protein
LRPFVALESVSRPASFEGGASSQSQSRVRARSSLYKLTDYRFSMLP